ncbi:MAG: hypothetical protein AAF490_25990 [Chloroflexota bacterium]
MKNTATCAEELEPTIRRTYSLAEQAIATKVTWNETPANNDTFS